MSSANTLWIGLRGQRPLDAAPWFVQVTVRDSPFDLPRFEASETRVEMASEILTLAERFYSREITVPQMVCLGRHLARVTFPGKLATQIYQRVTSGKPLRVVLLFDLDQDDLVFLPWEMVRYDAESNDEPESLKEPYTGFLALRLDISIVRQFTAVARGDDSPIGSKGALTVFSSGKAPLRLDLNPERNAIERSAKAAGLRLVDCTPKKSTLAPAIRTNGSKLGLLHFSGHGKIGSKCDGGSAIFLEDDDGKYPDPMSAEDLAVLCANSKIRVAVLNACETGAEGGDGAVGPGVGTALFRTGVTTVVAMQTKIRESAGEAFAKAFYQGLGAKQTVDSATSFARYQIYQSAQKAERWQAFSPVLYRHFEIAVCSDVNPPDSYEKSDEIDNRKQDGGSRKGFWVRILGAFGISLSLYAIGQLQAAGSLWQTLIEAGSLGVLICGCTSTLLFDEYRNNHLHTLEPMQAKLRQLEEVLRREVGCSFDQIADPTTWVRANQDYGELVATIERWVDPSSVAPQVAPFLASKIRTRSNAEIVAIVSRPLLAS